MQLSSSTKTRKTFSESINLDVIWDEQCVLFLHIGYYSLKVSYMIVQLELLLNHGQLRNESLSI